MSFPCGSAATRENRPSVFCPGTLGATLSLLDVTDNIVGGRIAITGQVADAAGKRVLRGHVDGDNYNLIRAPGLAKVLSLTSLSAIGSMLAGSGIPFSTLRGEFALSEDRLTLDNVLAYGEAIGVTGNGLVDLHRTARSAGDDRAGLCAELDARQCADRRLALAWWRRPGPVRRELPRTGPTADPQISVNPLSALAPGFLRRLLQPNLGLPLPAQQSLAPQ